MSESTDAPIDGEDELPPDAPPSEETLVSADAPNPEPWIGRQVVVSIEGQPQMIGIVSAALSPLGACRATIHVFDPGSAVPRLTVDIPHKSKTDKMPWWE